MTLNLDKNAKRILKVEKDDGELHIRTKMPFKPKALEDGVLKIEAPDVVASDFDDIFMRANGLSGLKEVVLPEAGYNDDVIEAVVKVLKFGLNKTWKRISFPSSYWNVEYIVKKVWKEIDRYTYKVEKVQDGEGMQTDALVFEDLRMPPLTAESKKHSLRFQKGSESQTELNTLKFDEASIKWFKENKNSVHALEKFAEALAEQPQIQYVDFTKLNDKDIHELYGTIKEWERLLNIPGTVFKFTPSKKDEGDAENKDKASFENLKDRKDVVWHLAKNDDVSSGKKEAPSMCMKPTVDKIAVTKDKRLLWNRTALDCLFSPNGSLEKMLKDKFDAVLAEYRVHGAFC